MALHADTVAEMRTGGSNLIGGGFYDRNPGTSVDYSQQTAAQLSLTDLAMVTGGTTLTSAAGGFTAAMAGNLIYIASGTNFTAGWYEVTAYTDTNTVTLDVDATNGSNASSGVGKVGGCLALPTDAIVTAFSNMPMHLAAGTYTLTESLNLVFGGTIPHFIGYNTTRNDEPAIDDCPLIAAGAYYISANSTNGTMHYCRVTGTASITIQKWPNIVASKVENTSGSSNRIAIKLDYNGGQCVSCDLSSTNGYAVVPTTGTSITACKLHDSVYGIRPVTSVTVIDSTFSDCTYGWRPTYGQDGQVCKNNTFYACTTAIMVDGGTVTNGCTIINNNLVSNTTAFSGGGISSYASLVDYNNFHGNGTNRTSVDAGTHDTTTDPSFTDAAGGDFTPASGNAVYTQGMPITLGVGSTVTTHQGAVPPVASGGGGCFIAAGVGRLGVQES